MSVFRLHRAAVILAFASCSACAEEPVAEAATARPAVLADFYNYAGASEGDQGHGNALATIVDRTVTERDFASLNAMADYFRTSQSRLPGGTWELATFHWAIQQALEPRHFADAPCKLGGTDFTEAWAAFDPAHPAPYIAEAELRVSYAWCLRGGGYASETSHDAMDAFSSEVATAERVLSDHEDAAKRDPEYYVLMEKIYLAQGRGDWAFDSILGEGSARFPYYYGIYFNAAWRAMPQWGGSYEEVDEIARYAAERTRAKDGEGTYARVYWQRMECNCDLGAFSIDRKLLARAMDDVMTRTPSNWNAAHFAQMACRLRDRELAARQLARPGSESAIGWEDPAERERCRDFAA
jgi:hypothetical protein